MSLTPHKYEHVHGHHHITTEICGHFETSKYTCINDDILKTLNFHVLKTEHFCCTAFRLASVKYYVVYLIYVRNGHLLHTIFN